MEQQSYVVRYSNCDCGNVVARELENAGITWDWGPDDSSDHLTFFFDIIEPVSTTIYFKHTVYEQEAVILNNLMVSDASTAEKYFDLTNDIYTRLGPEFFYFCEIDLYAWDWSTSSLVKRISHYIGQFDITGYEDLCFDLLEN
jgi:hypothetical protein